MSRITKAEHEPVLNCRSFGEMSQAGEKSTEHRRLEVNYPTPPCLCGVSAQHSGSEDLRRQSAPRTGSLRRAEDLHGRCFRRRKNPPRPRLQMQMPRLLENSGHKYHLAQFVLWTGCRTSTGGARRSVWVCCIISEGSSSRPQGAPPKGTLSLSIWSAGFTCYLPGGQLEDRDFSHRVPQRGGSADARRHFSSLVQPDSFI